MTHPLTGENIEIWVGNYVLMGYGEGAVMGVPAHDERDFAFAKKYGLPIKQVIDVCRARSTAPMRGRSGTPTRSTASASTPASTTGSATRRPSMRSRRISAAKGLGGKQVQWRLRDWGISRQRYWGTPVPIIHCPTCGDVPVPDKDLPVALPENLVPDGTGNPLAKTPAFLDCQVPEVRGSRRGARPTRWTRSWTRRGTSCASPARTQAQAMVDERVKYWLPVDQYIGGIEHAILHLLYARFWSKVMRDLGLV